MNRYNYTQHGKHILPFKVGDRVKTYYLFPSSPQPSDQICRIRGIVEWFYYVDGQLFYSVKWPSTISDYWAPHTLEPCDYE